MPRRPAATVAMPRRAVGRGLLAIAVNILVLDGFDAAGSVTARGGLQKLVQAWLPGPLTRAGVGEA